MGWLADAAMWLDCFRVFHLVGLAVGRSVLCVIYKIGGGIVAALIHSLSTGCFFFWPLLRLHYVGFNGERYVR